MIKHMLLFRFKSDSTSESQQKVLRGLSDFPTHFPVMKNFGIGVNQSQRDQTFSHAMTIEFETMEDLKGYLNSEYHEHFTASVFRPAIEQRAIVSYETGTKF